VVSIVLVHGGLWDDTDAERFWVRPGIVAGLQQAGFAVTGPDRPRRAPSWAAEAEHLAGQLPPGPVTLIAGSNGCSAAVALALSRPVLVERLILAWPATAGDPDVDVPTATGLEAAGADAATVARLLAGESLRGCTDEQLAALPIPVGVLPSVPDNRFHRRRTVDALLKVIPSAVELPGTPEPPSPEFSPHIGGFVSAVRAFTVAP
jgi:pimeloyl-ACP methyl ester carboxylesterase